MFPENDFYWRFIMPTVSENRFSLAVYYADRQWKSIFTGGPQLSSCKNDDFYCPLALAVKKNVTVNRFTTATIELICTSAKHLYNIVLIRSLFYMPYYIISFAIFDEQICHQLELSFVFFWMIDWTDNKIISQNGEEVVRRQITNKSN
jgi:hypothetical protein